MPSTWTKNWTPIDPQLDDGNLRAIVDLFGPDVDAKPIPLTTSTPQGDVDFHYNYSSISLSTANTLALGNYVDAEVNFNQRVHCFDFAVGIFESFVGDTLPEHQVITGTFWGLAIRVFLRVRALKADFNVEAGIGPVAFASAVELGKATVEFQATGLCSDPKVFAAVLEGVPLTGKFDVSAYERFSEKLAVAQDALLESARSHPERLLPIGVMLSSDIDDAPFMDEAHSLRWALGRLKAMQRLSTALSNVPGGIDKDLVIELYRYKLGNDGGGDVTPEIADWAGKQL